MMTMMMRAPMKLCGRPRRWQVDGGIGVSADGRPRTAAKILSNPGVTIKDLERIADSTVAAAATAAASGETTAGAAAEPAHLRVDPEAIEAVQVRAM